MFLSGFLVLAVKFLVFDLSEITLPRIPELARGGVLEKGQIALLEGNGTEAVVPLEKDANGFPVLLKICQVNLENIG